MPDFSKSSSIPPSYGEEGREGERAKDSSSLSLSSSSIPREDPDDYLCRDNQWNRMSGQGLCDSSQNARDTTKPAWISGARLNSLQKTPSVRSQRTGRTFAWPPMAKALSDHEDDRELARSTLTCWNPTGPTGHRTDSSPAGRRRFHPSRSRPRRLRELQMNANPEGVARTRPGRCAHWVVLGSFVKSRPRKTSWLPTTIRSFSERSGSTDGVHAAIMAATRIAAAGVGNESAVLLITCSLKSLQRLELLTSCAFCKESALRGPRPSEPPQTLRLYQEPDFEGEFSLTRPQAAAGDTNPGSGPFLTNT